MGLRGAQTRANSILVQRPQCFELVAPFVPARKTAPISAIGYVDRITAQHYPFLSQPQAQFVSEIRVAGQKQPVQDLGYSLRSAFQTTIGAILQIEASPWGDFILTPQPPVLYPHRTSSGARPFLSKCLRDPSPIRGEVSRSSSWTMNRWSAPWCRSCRLGHSFLVAGNGQEAVALSASAILPYERQPLVLKRASPRDLSFGYSE
jgi:hypothetical protein